MNDIEIFNAIELDNILELEIAVEGVLKIINYVDEEIGIYMSTGDREGFDCMYEKLRCTTARLQDIVKRIKENRSKFKEIRKKSI